MTQNSFQKINLSADVSLSWATSFSSGLVLCDINNVLPTANNFKISFPSAKIGRVGTSVVFNNISAYSFSIVANDGATEITPVASGKVFNLYLNDNATTNGTWNVTPYGGGAASIATFTAESTGNTISITGGAITPPGGTINFELPDSIKNLNEVSTVGFAVISDDNPLTWDTRTITAGANIDIDDGDGASTNPVIKLLPTLTGLTSIEVGNFNFTGSSLNAVAVNSSLTINSNGTEPLELNGVTIDTNGNLAVPGTLTVTGSFNNTLTPKAYCFFTDTLLGMTSNIIVSPDKINISTVTGGAGNYTCTFSTARSNTNYSVIIDVGTDGTTLPPMFQGALIYASKSTTSFSIVITDASGEKVTAIPTGVTVLVMSST